MEISYAVMFYGQKYDENTQVEKEVFKQVVKKLLPRYNIPGRPYLLSSYVILELFCYYCCNMMLLALCGSRFTL